MKGGKPVVKKVFYQQNDGRLSGTPSKHLGTVAKVCWRKIVPFLESTERVKRIDTALVELYCSQYEIYRQAYDDVLENGIQTKIFKSLQDASGSIVGKDFVGYRKNPAVATMKDASIQITSIGSQLGLSPKARAELMQLVDSKEKEDSKEDSTEKLAKIFGGES